MKTTKWDYYKFDIAGHYLSALINGDQSGLSTKEAVEFNHWRDLCEGYAKAGGYTIGHWDCADECDDWGICEVCDKLAMRTSVTLHVYKDE